MILLEYLIVDHTTCCNKFRCIPFQFGDKYGGVQVGLFLC
jgi:hypothetical protein